METVLSFDAAAGRRQEMRAILADYLAVDRVRVYRRLFVVRCTLAALLALAASYLVGGLSLPARWVPIGLMLAPAIAATLVELRLHARLARRVRQVQMRKS